MKPWPRLPLGAACEINPRLQRSERIDDDAAVSFVPMAAVCEVAGAITDRQTRRYAEVRKGYTHFRDGDVLFAKITPCMENGKVALAVGLENGLGFGSTEFHVLRAGPKVLPEWVYYFVKRERFREEAKRSFTGSAGQQRVPASFLESSLIPVPPLDEQRRIVDVLSRAEGIVRLRREAQNKAAELVPAIFLEMFGDPATNPKGWAKVPLCSVAEIISGVTKGRALRPEESIDLPYLRVANVKDGYLDLAEVKTIPVRHGEIERLLVRPGDLLMTEGGDPDKLGRAALWSGQIEHCVHQNHVFKVRCDVEQLSPIYLRSLVGSSYGKAYFMSVAKKTTGIASINKTQLSVFPVLIPPRTAQKDFERRVMAAESVLQQQNEALSIAADTRESLLNRMFSPHQ